MSKHRENCYTITVCQLYYRLRNMKHVNMMKLSISDTYFSNLSGEMQLETPLSEPTPELATIIQIPERMACNSCVMEFQTREDQVLVLWRMNNTHCKFRMILALYKILCTVWFVVKVESMILLKWKSVTVYMCKNVSCKCIILLAKLALDMLDK